MPSAVFSAPDGVRGHTLRYFEQDAKSICRWCSVVLTRRNYALKGEESEGIWGGLPAAARSMHHRAGYSASLEQLHQPDNMLVELHGRS
ncbi:hypothetical protein CH289_04440 [Rhodococcus sp. RS1C4]|nr:hypothetical protein CH289_04440 [Rhodococcus sp. RS1C4]